MPKIMKVIYINKTQKFIGRNTAESTVYIQSNIVRDMWGKQ